MTTRKMTDEDWRYIVYFHKGEFRNPELMSYDFVAWLDRVRAAAHVKMRVTSSYRTPEYNAAVGGAVNSAHCDIPCMAVDISPTPTAFDPHGNQARYAIVKTALELGCTRIGIYKNGSIHLDMSARIKRVMWHAL